MGAPTCVSDIAQIIDRVSLNSWLCKVLQNCYFVMKLIFESLLFKEPIFYMFSEGLLFQKMLFCTANRFFTVTFFIYHLVISILIPTFLHSNDPRVHRVGAPPR